MGLWYWPELGLAPANATQSAGYSRGGVLQAVTTCPAKEHAVARPGELDERVDTIAARVESRVTDMIVRLAFLGLFVFWALDLVGPFLPVVIWSVILAVALHPVHAWLAARLGGSGRLAAVILTLLLLAIVIGPVALLGTSLAEAVQALAAPSARERCACRPRRLGMADWPLIGEKAQAAWSLASQQSRGRGEAVRPDAAADRHRDPAASSPP